MASIALPISLSRSSRAALIPSIRDPFTTPISIGAPFPIDKVHCHSSMPPWGLTEIFRSKGSYFDCILQICPFGEPDQPQICALFKLTHYRRLSWRPLSLLDVNRSSLAVWPVPQLDRAAASRKRRSSSRSPQTFQPEMLGKLPPLGEEYSALLPDFMRARRRLRGSLIRASMDLRLHIILIRFGFGGIIRLTTAKISVS